VLTQALLLAEPEGYVRTFVDEGPALAGLLRRVAGRGVAPNYARRMLEAFAETPRVMPAVAQPIVEPLTERELEVLQLLAAGLSNRAMAQALVITVGTVKRHITNIYGKLGVNNRVQAVAKARELNVLQP